jgi:hypothetical protein
MGGSDATAEANQAIERAVAIYLSLNIQVRITADGCWHPGTLNFWWPGSGGFQ